MTATARPVAAHPASSGRWLLIAAVAVLAAGVIALRVVGGAPPLSPTVPISPEIEAAWGIRITQVGVTADGGLVDLRYLVLDADKALGLVSSETNIPILIDESSGLVVRSAALMTAKHDISAGASSFLLYRNTRGLIQRGAQITIRFGDLSVEHVPVL